MSTDLGRNADEVFESFVQILADCARGPAFDTVIAAGDSGSAMAGFARLVYDAMHLELPMLVLLPVFRPSEVPILAQDKQDAILARLAAEQLQGVQPDRALILDDEISSGETLTIALQAIRQTAGSAPRHMVMLAEDQGFQVSSLAAGMTDVDFRPFSKEHDDIPNAIFWFIPYEYERPIQLALQHVMSDRKDRDKWPMLILLNMPIKNLVDGEPRFTYDVHEQVRALEPRLTSLQQGFQEVVRQKARAVVAHGRFAY